MKQFSDITAQRPKQPSESEHTHLSKLSRFVKGEKVRGDDLVKAGLWLVAEVVRCTETPYFQRERLKAYLSDVGELARKQLLLLQGWPGLHVDEYFIDSNKRILSVFSCLTSMAPGREDCCD